MQNLFDINENDNTYSKKITNLIKFKNFGFNVPDGIVLSQSDFDTISLDDIPFDIFSIRSATFGEDNPDSSFAGVFNTILNSTKDTFFDDLKIVINSFYSKKSIIYQNLKNITVVPQILIQPMITSLLSSVIFIDNNHIKISLNNGSCNDIVSGTKNCFTYEFLIDDFKHSDIKFPDELVNNNFILFIKKILINININSNMLIDIETTFDGNKWWVLQYRELNFIRI